MYCARIQGLHAERLFSELEEAAMDLGFVATGAIRAWLERIKKCFEDERTAIQERRTMIRELSPRVLGQTFEHFQMELIGTPVEVRTITVPTSNSDDSAMAERCGICLEDPDSTSVLTQACRHPFCEECLQTWILACQANSHRCPLCRTEMFKKPSY